MSEFPSQVKQFKIVRRIGIGGMGEVYLAEDTTLDRKVALKFLSGAMADNAEARARFLREAKSAAALDHPYICKIYETGEIDGQAWIAMEFVEGRELRDQMDEGPIPVDEAVRIATDVAEALGRAHGAGIVHRDLKPANIMVTEEGYVKVMDFGLAKRQIEAEVEEANETLFATRAGMVMGTVPYMSPEQTRGEEVGPEADVFALGIILQEMITGEHPFPGATMADVISAIMRDAPPPMGARAGHLGAGLERVAAQAMSKNKEDRYPDARALAADLRQLRAGAAASMVGMDATVIMQAPPVEAEPEARRWAVPLLAAFAVVALALAGWYALGSRSGGAGGGPDLPPMSALIADLDNATGDPDLDGALETTLGLNLQAVPNLTLFSRTAARAEAAQLDPGGDGRVDTAVAQLIARSEGLNMIIAGRIEPGEAGGLSIRLQAIDPVTSETLAETTRDLASKGEFLQATEALAGEMRGLLAEVPPESLQAQSEETFTTTSLAALRAYTSAQHFVHEGRIDEAIAQFEVAVAEDASFGRAYAGLATAYYNNGDTETAERYYQLALQNIDRMTDREKYRTRGGYYLRNRDYRRAIQEYDALTREYPYDPAGPGNLAFAHFLARNMDEAVQFGQLGVQIAPDNLNAHFNLAWFAMTAGDFDLAESEARTVLEANPGFAEAELLVGLAELGRGRTGGAAAVYDRIATRGDRAASLAVHANADLAVYQGRLADAAQLLRSGIAADSAADASGSATVKRAFLATVLQQLGDGAGALAAARQAASDGGSDSVQLSAGLTLARGRAGNEALEIAGRLGAKLQPEPRAYAKLIEGEVMLAEGQASTAVQLLSDSVDLLDTWLGRVALGRAYLAAEAYPEAHAELENAMERAGEATSVYFDDLPSYRFFPPVHFYLGEALSGLGAAAAPGSYEAFLQIKATDEDPLVAQARARLGR